MRERAEQAPFALNETLVYLIRRADSKSGPYYDVFALKSASVSWARRNITLENFPSPRPATS